MTNVISIMDATVRLDRTTILSHVNLSLAPGEVVAVLGPSGAGKSTLLRLVLGFVPPDPGQVLLGGVPASVDGVIVRPVQERNLAVVFQDLALWPHMTVEQNLAFGLRARGVSRQERGERIHKMLERVDLTQKGGRYPAQLSGGEQQRVAIARALVLEPDAILMDEPLSSLDIVLRHDLLDLFRDLFRESQAAVLYISHDPWEASLLADRVVVLEHGRVAYEGQFADIPSDHESRFVRRIRLADGAHDRMTT